MSALLPVLVLALALPFVGAQFSTASTQPLCASALAMNCSNYAPQDGAVILGWNIDFDRHDNISALLNRMSSTGTPGFSTTPGAYGIFMKVGATGLVGQTADGRSEDLDTMLAQMKGTNAILVTSIDPFDGFDSVTDGGLEIFADKLAEFNKFGIPVFVRPGREMNGPWFIYGQQPAKFKAFYRKVHSIVRAKAPHTVFVFAPTIGNEYPFSYVPPKVPHSASDVAIMDTNGNGILDKGDDPYEPYWPGNDVVDWFGVSLYFKGTYPWNVTEPAPPNYIRDLFSIGMGGGSSTYEFARRRNLPIVIAELAGSFSYSLTGVTNLETKRNLWIEAFGPNLRTLMPLLKMALWFDYSKFEDGAQRDFSISYRNDTVLGGSLTEVAPVFKQDIASYKSVVYSSNLKLSDSGNCGCFRNSATKLQLNFPAKPTQTSDSTEDFSTKDKTKENSSGCAAGCIVGISFGAIALIAIGVGAFFLIKRRKKPDTTYKSVPPYPPGFENSTQPPLSYASTTLDGSVSTATYDMPLPTPQIIQYGISTGPSSPVNLEDNSYIPHPEAAPPVGSIVKISPVYGTSSSSGDVEGSTSQSSSAHVKGQSGQPQVQFIFVDRQTGNVVDPGDVRPVENSIQPTAAPPAYESLPRVNK